MKMLLVATLLSAMCGPAQAQVYKCKQPDGSTVFADAPCAAGAKPIDVSPASGSAPGDAAHQGNSAPGARRMPTRNEQADIAVRRRLLQNDIDLQERRIAATIDEMNAKLAELRNRKRYANNNLAGATWEQSVSEEMSATSAGYETELKGMRDELARLRQMRDRVGQQ